MKSNVIKMICVVFSIVSAVSLSSCDSFKRSFAGNLTDKGISMDSYAPGQVFVPEALLENPSSSPYDTLWENSLFVGGGAMCDFQNALSVWREKDSSLFENVTFFCGENFGVYENNYSDPDDPTSAFPTASVWNETVGDFVESKCTVEEAVLGLKIKRVVFCLAGVNDLPVYGDEENCHVKTAADMGKLIKSLTEKLPDVIITVISTPPICENSTQMKTLNNENIRKLNMELEKVCTMYGGDFINASKLFENGNGALKDEYSYDGYCGLNDEGCKVILSSLRYYAKERKGEI